MRLRMTFFVVVLVALGRLAAPAFADDAPKTDVAKWYAEDHSRRPKCKVDPRIEQAYPDIHATLLALKYALVHDKFWAGKTWKQREDIAAVRKGEIEALDDPEMLFGWKADQKPLKEIKKGSVFNDAVTKSATRADFHIHTFLTGNDTDPIGPRPPAEVMETLAHELAHVWDHRAHFVTQHSVEAAGHGLPYDFQKLVPKEPFAPEAIHEIRVIMGTAEPAKEEADDKDEDPNEEENPNKFYIYAIETSGMSLYVARPDEAAKLTRGPALPDSGLDGSKVEAKKLSTKGFMSKEDAVNHLRLKAKKSKHSKWTGHWVKYKGGEYRTVHVGEWSGQ